MSSFGNSYIHVINNLYTKRRICTKDCERNIDTKEQMHITVHVVLSIFSYVIAVQHSTVHRQQQLI